VEDDEGDPAALNFEFRSGTGGWRPMTPTTATPSMSAVAAAPTGVVHRFTWDSRADVPTSSSVEVRVLPAAVGTGATGSASGATVTVDNSQPSAPIPSTPEPATNPAAIALRVTDGDQQRALAGHRLEKPLEVQLLENGAPLPQIAIDYFFLAGPPPKPMLAQAPSISQVTNSGGKAGVHVIVPDAPGVSIVRASPRGMPDKFVDFTITSLPWGLIDPGAGPALVRPGESQRAIWRLDGDADQATNEFWDGDDNPVPVAVTTQNTDRPAQFTFAQRGPALEIPFTPTGAPGTVASVTVAVGVGVAKISRTRQVTVDRAINSSRIIQRHPTIVRQDIAFRLDPLSGTGQRALPGVATASGFTVALRDDGNRDYDNIVMLSGCGILAIPPPPPVDVTWAAQNAFLTKNPSVATSDTQMVATFAEPVYAIPQDWGPASVTATVSGAVPDELGRCFIWTDSGGQQHLEVHDTVSVSVSYTYHLEPIYPVIEILQANGTWTESRELKIGESTRVAVDYNGGHMHDRPKVRLVSLMSDGTALDRLIVRPDAPSEQIVELNPAGTAMLSAPIGLRTGRAVSGDPAVQKQLVDYRGRVRLKLESSVLVSSPTSRDYSMADVVGRPTSPRRDPTAAYRPAPLNPRGYTPRAGVLGWIRPHSGELSFDWVDMTRDIEGLRLFVGRSYRSLVERSGPFGPGWSLLSDQHLIFDPGEPQGLYTRVDSDGEEEHFLGWRGPTGVYDVVTRPNLVGGRSESYEFLSPDGEKLRFDWDGSLREHESRHGQIVRYFYDHRGRLSHIEGPQGAGFTIDYHPDNPATPWLLNRIRTITDDTGRVLEYLYHDPSSGQGPAGTLAQVLFVNPARPNVQRASVRYGYSAESRLNLTADAGGRTMVEYHYQADGRIEREEALGGRTRLAYPSTMTVVVNDPRQRDHTLVFHPSVLADRSTLATVTNASAGSPGEPPNYLHRLVFTREGELSEGTFPDGGGVALFYDTTHPNRRSHGNLRVIRERASGKEPDRITSYTYEARFNLVRSVVGPVGHASGNLASDRTVFVYDHTSTTPPANPHGDLVEIRRPRGVFQVLGRDAQGNDRWFTVVDHLTSKFRHNGAGQIIERIDVDGNVTTWSYDGRGYPTAIVFDARADDPRRRALDPLTPARPQRWTLQPDQLGFITGYTTPDGVTATFDVDRLGRVWEARWAGGGVDIAQSYEFDTNGHLRLVSGRQGAAGGPTTTVSTREILARNALGQPTLIRENAGGASPLETRLVYGPDTLVDAVIRGGVERRVDRTGVNLPWRSRFAVGTPTERTTQITRNLRGDPVDVAAPSGRSRYFYNGHGDLQAVVSPEGDIGRLVFDPNGRFIEVSVFDGRGGRNPNFAPDAPGALLIARERLTLDPDRRPTRYDRFRFLPDPAHFTFAQVGNQLGLPPGAPLLPDGPLTPGDGARTSFFNYDRTGNRTRTLADNMVDRRVRFDVTGNEIDRIEQPHGVRVHRVVDASGLLLSEDVNHGLSPGIFPPLTQTRDGLRVNHDAQNRAVMVTNALNQTARFEYDASRRIVGFRDPDGVVTRYRYNERNRLREVVLAAGTPQETTRIFVYHADGKLWQVRQGNQLLVTLDYHPDRTLSTLTYADGSTERFSWHPSGHVASITGRDGQTLGFVYDRRGALTRVTKGKTVLQQFEYDALGRLKEMQDNIHQVNVTREVDSFGYLLTDHQRTPGQNVRVTSQRDSLGQLVELSYPRKGFRGKLSLLRDSYGRLASQTDGTGNRLSLYRYRGNEPEIAAVGPFERHFKRDPAGQISGLKLHSNQTGGTVADLDYTLAPDGLRNTLSWQLASGLNVRQTLDRDPLDRLKLSDLGLTGAHTESLRNEYDFDPFGNWRERKTQAGGGALVTETFVGDPAGRYTQAGGAPIQYDGAGRVTRYISHRYQYDDLGRLEAIRDAATNQVVRRYVYDALSRLVGEDGAAGIRQYVWYGNQIIEERDGQGTLIESFRYAGGVDRPEAVERPTGGEIYILSDEVGHVAGYFDAAGSVREWITYDGFGRPTFRDASGAPKSGSFMARPRGLGGAMYDPDTGLYYHRHRFYHPQLGRFLTPDPIGYAGGENLYALAGSQPWDARDPYGLFDIVAFGEGLLDVVKEPFAAVGDVLIVAPGVKIMNLFRDDDAQIALEDVPWGSMSARSTTQRILSGESGLVATMKGEGHFVANLLTVGAWGLGYGHYEAYQLWSSGQITTAEYDAMISRLAGNLTGGAVLAKGGQRYFRTRIEPEQRTFTQRLFLGRTQTAEAGPIIRLLSREISPSDGPVLNFLNRPVPNPLRGVFGRIFGRRSNPLSEIQDLGIVDEQGVQLLLGERIGSGMNGEAYRYAFDRNFIVKLLRENAVDAFNEANALNLYRTAIQNAGIADRFGVVDVVAMGRLRNGGTLIVKSFARGTVTTRSWWAWQGENLDLVPLVNALRNTPGGQGLLTPGGALMLQDNAVWANGRLIIFDPN
jgi:RHS repeat-associated protein